MRQRGFTIIELITAVAIAGLVLAAGLPAFGAFNRTLREREARDELRQRIRGARQAAVTRHCPVIVAFGNGVSTTGITGYTVHVDSNGDRVRQSTEAGSNYTLPRNCQLAVASFTPNDTLIFDLSGALWPGSVAGQLVITGSGRADTLAISATGMVYDP